MVKAAEGSQDAGGSVVGDIIHDQDNVTGWIAHKQEVFDKLDESLAIRPIGHSPADLVRVPTIGTEDVRMLLTAGLQSRTLFC
jgi:hypothetical protein